MSKASKRKKEAAEIVLNVMSNSPKEYQLDMLQMLYTGALENTLGLMEAMNEETGSTELLLVGMTFADKTYNAYPLAKLLSPEETKKYLAPDGKGGYEGAPAQG